MRPTPTEAALEAHLLSIGGTAVHLERSMIPAVHPEDLDSGAPVPFLDDAERLPEHRPSTGCTPAFTRA